MVNLGFIPCPARRKTLTYKIRFLAYQFYVEHARIIGTLIRVARRKPPREVAQASGLRWCRQPSELALQEGFPRQARGSAAPTQPGSLRQLSGGSDELRAERALRVFQRLTNLLQSDRTAGILLGSVM